MQVGFSSTPLYCKNTIGNCGHKRLLWHPVICAVAQAQPIEELLTQELHLEVFGASVPTVPVQGDIMDLGQSAKAARQTLIRAMQ